MSRDELAMTVSCLPVALDFGEIGFGEIGRELQEYETHFLRHVAILMG